MSKVNNSNSVLNYVTLNYFSTYCLFHILFYLLFYLNSCKKKIFLDLTDKNLCVEAQKYLYILINLTVIIELISIF